MNHTAGFEDRIIGTGARTAGRRAAARRVPGATTCRPGSGRPARSRPTPTTARRWPATSWPRSAASRTTSTSQDHILDPLGMAHSTATEPVPAALAGDLARSYNSERRRSARSRSSSTARPDGSISATADDMARFMTPTCRRRLGGTRRPRRRRPRPACTSGHSRPTRGWSGYAHGFKERTINGHRVAHARRQLGGLPERADPRAGLRPRAVHVDQRHRRDRRRQRPDDRRSSTGSRRPAGTPEPARRRPPARSASPRRGPASTSRPAHRVHSREAAHPPRLRAAARPRRREARVPGQDLEPIGPACTGRPTAPTGSPSSPVHERPRLRGHRRPTSTSASVGGTRSTFNLVVLLGFVLLALTAVLGFPLAAAVRRLTPAALAASRPWRAARWLAASGAAPSGSCSSSSSRSPWPATPASSSTVCRSAFRVLLLLPRAPRLPIAAGVVTTVMAWPSGRAGILVRVHQVGPAGRAARAGLVLRPLEPARLALRLTPPHRPLRGGRCGRARVKHSRDGLGRHRPSPLRRSGRRPRAPR